MLPVIIPVFNRPRLLKQTLTSLFKHSHSPVFPVVIDDFSSADVRQVCRPYLKKDQLHYYRLSRQCGPGIARTYGAALAPKHHSFIYFSDADVYFQPDWDNKMISTLAHHPEFGMLVGSRYQVLKPKSSTPAKYGTIEELFDTGGSSLLISLENWFKAGPFKSVRIGGSGEDADLCHQIKKLGLKIGSLNPPVVLHCGLHSTIWQTTPESERIHQLKAARPDIIIE